ncbi:MAG: DUF6428 family protein [Flavobacteriaceae bacterium]|nr:DUF6428 family protein [Flavobacteriaceae bacterium]MDG1962394.1 DUF6428 family protein [Flavobacteriaceae bacterium]
MKISQVKSILDQITTMGFKLPDGGMVPAHFHVTEMGHVSKNFIDCGGTVRLENAVSFQLWHSDDVAHRLQPDKLRNIIEQFQNTFGTEDWEVDIEYQGATIQRYGLAFDGVNFLLTTKQTDCLAKDHCGIPEAKPRTRRSNLTVKSACTPGGNCC